MALQSFPNAQGLLLSPYPHTYGNQAQTCDAAGESVAGIGYVVLSSGIGTSKTISAGGGGKIHWRASAATFSNGSTNLRVGINDVGATGLEDGTHDVYGDLTGGTDTISTTAINSTNMETGTKTIAHGDLIAIVVEMTAKGGADSVAVGSIGTSNSIMPYMTADTGSGPARVVRVPQFTIEFDDGTIGYIDHSVQAPTFAVVQTNVTAYGTGSTPDEYALVFQIPFRAQATGLFAILSSVVSTDDFELILYSDPLGTPSASKTITQDADLVGVINPGYYSRQFSSAMTLEANTDYAIALRPTTANTLTFQYIDFGSGNANCRKATVLGTNWSMYSRSDQTGAFGTQVTTQLPCFGVWLSQLSDDVSTGGFVGIIGGV